MEDQEGFKGYQEASIIEKEIQKLLDKYPPGEYPHPWLNFTRIISTTCDTIHGEILKQQGIADKPDKTNEQFIYLKSFWENMMKESNFKYIPFQDPYREMIIRIREMYRTEKLNLSQMQGIVGLPQINPLNLPEATIRQQIFEGNAVMEQKVGKVKEVEIKHNPTCPCCGKECMFEHDHQMTRDIKDGYICDGRVERENNLYVDDNGKIDLNTKEIEPRYKVDTGGYLETIPQQGPTEAEKNYPNSSSYAKRIDAQQEQKDNDEWTITNKKCSSMMVHMINCHNACRDERNESGECTFKDCKIKVVK